MDMSVARGGGGMDLREKVGEIGVAPLSTNHLAKTGPKKLGRGAREEDVVSILHRAAQGAKPISGSVTLEDFDSGGEAATDPLPKEDPNLQWQADIPDQTEGPGGGRGGDCRI